MATTPPNPSDSAARAVQAITAAAVDVERPASAVHDWHAHVYFDAGSRDAAWFLRERIDLVMGDRVVIGRFHERPVGPHPMWSFQIAFRPALLPEVMGWLTLNHGALDVLVHPNTGDALSDHRDSAAWIGQSHTLDLSGLSRPV